MANEWRRVWGPRWASSPAAAARAREDPEDAVAVEGPSRAGEEEGLARAAVHAGPALVEPRADGVGGRGAQRDPALLAALADAADEPVLQPQVGEPPVAGLLDARARGVEGLEEGAIPEVERSLARDRGEQPLDGRAREDARQVQGLPAGTQALGRVRGQPAHRQGEAHEATERGQAARHGGGRAVAAALRVQPRQQVRSRVRCAERAATRPSPRARARTSRAYATEVCGDTPRSTCR